MIVLHQSGIELLVNMALVAYISRNSETPEDGSVLYFPVSINKEPVYLVVDETLTQIKELMLR
jgi:hypothetical protein